MAENKGEMVSVYFPADKLAGLEGVRKEAEKTDRSQNYVIVQTVLERFGKPAKK